MSNQYDPLNVKRQDIPLDIGIYAWSEKSSTSFINDGILTQEDVEIRDPDDTDSNIQAVFFKASL